MAERETLLAVALREATTNILRHSSATQAVMRLNRTDSGWNLIISNDGARRANGGGTGLTGLHDRASRFGGRVTTRRDADRFELTVTIPNSGAPVAAVGT